MLPFVLRHSMWSIGGGDVSNCVYYGVGIAVFSEGRIAKCTFTL